MGLFDLLRRSPATPDTGKPPLSPRGDSGRGHTNGFLELEELNSDLQGTRGLQVYDRMYRTDGDVRGAVAMAIGPCCAATWTLEPFGGDQATALDRQTAEDLAWALGIGPEGSTSPLGEAGGLIAHLAEAMPVLVRSGFCPTEITWTRATRDGRQLLVPSRLGLRLPRSIHRWIPDVNGELAALEQFRRTTGELVELPRQDLLYYRVGAEGDNWEGVSMLRPAYKHWYIKDKVERLDAMGQEREAIGIPVAYPPMNAGQEILDDLGQKMGALRNGELAWLMMPGPKVGPDGVPGWEFDIMGLGGAGAKRSVGETLSYHRDGIRSAFVEEFMRLGHAGVGARATAQVQQDPFLLAVQALCDIPRLEISGRLLARFCALNYGPDAKLPTVQVSFTEGDLQELVTYVTSLIGAGAMFPDSELEDYLRERGKLPAADPVARDAREKQTAEKDAAELEAAKRGPVLPPGALGSEKTVVKHSPAGREKTTETVKHLAQEARISTTTAFALLDDAMVTLNWVDDVGGLPKKIHQLMVDLQQKGHRQDEAVAIAVSQAKKNCARGSGDATGWCDAVSEWERKKAQAHTLDDAAVQSTKDAAALQVTQAVACKCVGTHHAEDCPNRARTLAAAPVRQPWHDHMGLDAYEQALDEAVDDLQTTAAVPVRELAAAYAAAILEGGTDVQPSPADTAELTTALTGPLSQLYALGDASVRAELRSQTNPTPLAVTLEQLDDLTHVLADAGDARPGLPVRAAVAAHAIASGIWQAIARKHLAGIGDLAILTATGEQAGDTTARQQGRLQGSGAFNGGRDAAATDLSDAIAGARYTSILDRNRCEQCAIADDGVLRSLDDPVRLARKPPNPDCYGGDRCRCMEFFQLKDEAPASLEERLDDVLTLDIVSGRSQRRDPRGRYAKVLARVKDPAGRDFTLTSSGWRHITRRHPELADYQALVMSAVTQPLHHESDPHPSGRRERFYGHAPEGHKHSYLRVVVAHPADSALPPHVVEGELVSAIPRPKLP